MYDRLQAKTLVAPYKWIWAMDSALDHSCKDFAERYARYAETGDESHLPIREGLEPVRWTLKHLRPRDKRRVRNELEREKASATAMRIAAELVIDDVTGLDVEIRHVTDPRTGSVTVDPDVLDQLDAIPGLIDSIGVTAWGRASLDPK